MDEDVERMGRICHGPGCQVVGQYSPPDLMQSTESLTGPWQDFAADLMGSLATSESLLERGSRLLRSVLRGGYDAINNHIQDHHGVKRNFYTVWKPLLAGDR